jgi:hypothetical protein
VSSRNEKQELSYFFPKPTPARFQRGWGHAITYTVSHDGRVSPTAPCRSPSLLRRWRKPFRSIPYLDRSPGFLHPAAQDCPGQASRRDSPLLRLGRVVKKETKIGEVKINAPFAFPPGLKPRSVPGTSRKRCGRRASSEGWLRTCPPHVESAGRPWAGVISSAERTEGLIISSYRDHSFKKMVSCPSRRLFDAPVTEYPL